MDNLINNISETEYTKTELDKCEDFIRYSHDKIQNYNNAMETVLLEARNEFKKMNTQSSKLIDSYKLKMINKKCSEALFWLTKSHELISVLYNYYTLARYNEVNVLDFKNATQRLYITNKSSLNDEYPISSNLENITITLMNLGYDITRNVSIVTRIVNNDLGINIVTTLSKSFICERMNTLDIILPTISAPSQQCRADLIIEILNDRNEVLLNENIKEIFFRKEVI